MTFWLIEGGILVTAFLAILLELFFVQTPEPFVISFCLVMIAFAVIRIRDKVRYGDPFKTF